MRKKRDIKLEEKAHREIIFGGKMKELEKQEIEEAKQNRPAKVETKEQQI